MSATLIESNRRRLSSSRVAVSSRSRRSAVADWGAERRARGRDRDGDTRRPYTVYGHLNQTRCMVGGMATLAVHLVVNDPDSAAAWYTEALGAIESSRVVLPDGRTFTVELRIGDTIIAIAGEMPTAGMRTPTSLGGSASALHLAVPDIDAAWQRAVAAGATVFEPLHDAFWGDRTGQFLDPSGHRWALDQHVRDVPSDEIARTAAQLLGGSTP
jgi:PhnB protein